MYSLFLPLVNLSQCKGIDGLQSYRQAECIKHLYSNNISCLDWFEILSHHQFILCCLCSFIDFIWIKIILSTQMNKKFSQNSQGENLSHRSIPFENIVGEKMGYQTRDTVNRPQTPIKNLPQNQRAPTQGTAYKYSNTPQPAYVQPQPLYQYHQHLHQPQPQPHLLPQPQPQPQPQYKQSQHYTVHPQQKVEHVVTGQVPPQPQRRVEYVPYEQKYIDYVEQRVWVPVQRACTDYYQVQHIVDYMPIEKEEIIYVTEPKETVDMKIQYVPVQQKIIHLTEANAKLLGYDTKNKNLAFNQTDMTHTFQPGYQEIGTPIQQIQPRNFQREVQNVNQFNPKRSRTNFVTTEGYDPNENMRNIDKILSQSAARQSRVQSHHSHSRVVI